MRSVSRKLKTCKMQHGWRLHDSLSSRVLLDAKADAQQKSVAASMRIQWSEGSGLKLLLASVRSFGQGQEYLGILPFWGTPRPCFNMWRVGGA